jgi:type IV secretory pathway TraG/TraD family ATPase VirD4
MRVPDTDTAEYVAKHFGTRKRISSSISPGGGIITKEVEEPLVKPEDVLKLGPRQFYLFTYNGQFKGKTLDVEENYIEIKFPKISAELQGAVS